MKDWLLTLLRCPFVECRSPLELDADETEREVREGRLRCRTCHREYPITDGVVSLYGPMPDESVKRGEIDGWRTLMGLGPRPEGAHSGATPPSHAGTGLSSVTAATSWDKTGRCPAVVRYGDGLTLAVGFSDRSQVESVEVDASPIGRSSRLRLSDPFENHALSRGVVARVPPRLAGQSLSLPYRVRLGSGALLTGEIPVAVTPDPTLRPDFEQLLALPDAPPLPNERPGERTYWRQSTLALDSCLALLGLRGDERILEVGAGSGWASRRFAERGCQVVALDINPENLAVATNYLYLTDVYFDRVLADAETLPFADESFDVVFGCAVLHHAASMPRLLAELRRVLSPRGRIVLLNETLRAITQSEAEALSVSPHELAAGVNEHAPTVVEYRRAFRASGLRCTARRTDALDPLFREEVFAQQGDVSAFTRARHWLARRRWLRPVSERLALLFESGAVSFVASKPPHAPGRLPARRPTRREPRRLAEARD